MAGQAFSDLDRLPDWQAPTFQPVFRELNQVEQFGPQAPFIEQGGSPEPPEGVRPEEISAEVPAMEPAEEILTPGQPVVEKIEETSDGTSSAPPDFVATMGPILAPAAVAERSEGIQPEMPTDPTARRTGTGMVLGGMIFAGIAIALSWLGLKPWLSQFLRAEPGTQTAVPRPQLFLMAVTLLPSLSLFWLAWGSLRRKRWALPLAHSLAWFVVLYTLVFVATLMVGGLAFPKGFQILPSAHSPEALAALKWIGIFGMALPILLVALYQRSHLRQVCARIDRRSRWTDTCSEPLLMLWWPCWLACFFTLGLLALGAAFPLYGRFMTPEAAFPLWAGIAGMFAVAALLLAGRDRLGWWLACLLFLFLGSTGIYTFVQVPWQEFSLLLGLQSVRGAPQEASPEIPLIILACLMPLLLTLLMARGILWPKRGEPLPEGDTPTPLPAGHPLAVEAAAPLSDEQTH
jgi:hypothetical protein